MGAFAANTAIAILDVPHNSCTKHRKPLKDGCDGQNIHNLLPRKIGFNQHLVIHDTGKYKRLNNSNF